MVTIKKIVKLPKIPLYFANFIVDNKFIVDFKEKREVFNTFLQKRFHYRLMVLHYPCILFC